VDLMELVAVNDSGSTPSTMRWNRQLDELLVESG